jgi:hypothetical protein
MTYVISKLSFPNTGGNAVSSITLSANLHGFAFRRIGSESYLIYTHFIISWLKVKLFWKWPGQVC